MIMYAYIHVSEHATLLDGRIDGWGDDAAPAAAATAATAGMMLMGWDGRVSEEL